MDETCIIPAWERIGATVHLVGSLKSGLLMKSRDIDFHIYTHRLDISESFSVIQEISRTIALKRNPIQESDSHRRRMSGMACPV